jgi:hypothetical protein
MRIRISEDNTGFAPASHRFSAVDDATYDHAPDQRPSPIGFGRTPEEARQDLLDQLHEEDQSNWQQLQMEFEEEDRLAFERAHAWGTR